MHIDILVFACIKYITCYVALFSGFSGSWMQSITEEMEEKYDLPQQYLESKKQMKDEEEEQDEEYFQEFDPAIPIKEEFPGRYNFQVSLGNLDSSKNWVVSI